MIKLFMRWRNPSAKGSVPHMGGVLCHMKTNKLFPGFIIDCEQRNQKESTITRHKYNFKFTICPMIGERVFSDLTLADMSPLIEDGHKRGVSIARSVVKTIRCLIRYTKRRKLPIPFEAGELELPVEGRIRDL